MMNNKKPIIISILIIIGLFSGLSYNVSKLVSNEELTREIFENVSLLLEKSIVRHGDIKVDYGLNLNFNIPEFEINSTVDQQPLIKIKEINVKAPILSLFFPGFPVKYIFTGFEIFTGNRFDEILNINKLQERMTYKRLFGLKMFNVGSKHSLLFENMNIIHNEISFPIQVIKVNHFSWNRPVAYEIKHQIVKSQLLPDLYADYSLIGEVDLGKAIEEKSLRTKSQIKINTIKIGKVLEIKSFLSGTISLHVGGRDWFDGHITTNGRVDMDSRFFLKKGVLSLLNMSLKIPVNDLSMLKELIPNANDSNRISINGEIKDIGSDLAVPQFEFEFTEPITSSIDDFSFTSNLKGTVSNNKMTTTFVTKFSEGEFKGEFIAPVFNKSTGLIFSLESNISLDVDIKDVDLKVMSLKKKSFYSLLKEFSKKSELSDKFKIVKINISNCSFGSEKLSGGGIFRKTKNSLITEEFKLIYGEGSMITNLEIDKKYIEAEFKMNNFNLEGLASVSNNGRLPISGIFSGNLRGVYSKSDQFSHEFSINIKGEDGELDKGQSIKSVGHAMEQFSPDLKISKSSNSFKRIELVGKFSNKKFIANKINFLDKKEELRVVGSANIITTDIKEKNYIGENSVLFAKLIDQKGKLWTKENSINLPKQIPLKIRRVNGEWVPDLLYTINKIKSSAK